MGFRLILISFLLFIMNFKLYSFLQSDEKINLENLKVLEKDRLNFYTKLNNIYSAYTEVDIDEKGIFLKMKNSTLPLEIIFTIPKEYIISGCILLNDNYKRFILSIQRFTNEKNGRKPRDSR